MKKRSFTIAAGVAALLLGILIWWAPAPPAIVASVMGPAADPQRTWTELSGSAQLPWRVGADAMRGGLTSAAYEKSLRSAFADDAIFDSIPEQRREHLVIQLADFFERWSGPEEQGYRDLMESWGGEITNPKYERIFVRSWDASREFAWRSFDVRRAMLEVVIHEDAPGKHFRYLPTIDQAYWVGTTQTAFEFDGTLTDEDRAFDPFPRAVVRVPAMASGEEIKVLYLVFEWSENAGLWLPHHASTVNRPGEAGYPIAF